MPTSCSLIAKYKQHCHHTFSGGDVLTRVVSISTKQMRISTFPKISRCLFNIFIFCDFLFQSKLGHLTLFICTAHGYIYGWNTFLRPSTYKWYTPPGYMLCLIVPSVVLVLKALVLLPCVDRTLTRIRQGWERNQPTEEIGKVTNL